MNTINTHQKYRSGLNGANFFKNLKQKENKLLRTLNLYSKALIQYINGKSSRINVYTFTLSTMTKGPTTAEKQHRLEASCKVIEIGGVRHTEQPRIAAWSRGRCEKVEDEDKDETSKP
ncbi:hypothetical protein YC2023_028612 [Brassica napus]